MENQTRCVDVYMLGFNLSMNQIWFLVLFYTLGSLGRTLGRPL